MSVRVDLLLSSTALRRAFELMENDGHQTLESLIEDLLMRGPVGTKTEPVPSGDVTKPNDALAMPAESHHLQLADPAKQPRGRLLFLTNRLSPLKLAARVLAGMTSAGEWPKPDDFQKRAAAAAREIGLTIRREDERFGRRGAERRWVGYPVGDDPDGSLRRFIFSFTLEVGGQMTSGPMWLLGLANRMGDRVALTEAGWRLAAARSPLLEGDGETTMSELEAAILREQLINAPDEREASREFVRALRRAAGSQPSLDRLLGTWHADWTANRTVAERGAMLGRLGELEVVSVQGRGTTARVEIGPHAHQLEAAEVGGVSR